MWNGKGRKNKGERRERERGELGREHGKGMERGREGREGKGRAEDK